MRISDWSSDVCSSDLLIEGFQAQGRTDLYFDYCAEFPVYVIAMVLGIRPQDLEHFHEWTAMLQIAAAPADEARSARLAVEAYMRAMIADRRKAPRDAIVSMLMRCEIELDGVREDRKDVGEGKRWSLRVY